MLEGNPSPETPPPSGVQGVDMALGRTRPLEAGHWAPRGQSLGKEELWPFSSLVRGQEDAPRMGEGWTVDRGTDTQGVEAQCIPSAPGRWRRTPRVPVGWEPWGHPTLADGRPLPLASAAPGPRGAPLPAAGTDLPGCSLPVPWGVLTPAGRVEPRVDLQPPPPLPARANPGIKTPVGLGDTITTSGDIVTMFGNTVATFGDTVTTCGNSQPESRSVLAGRIYTSHCPRSHTKPLLGSVSPNCTVVMALGTLG